MMRQIIEQRPGRELVIDAAFAQQLGTRQDSPPDLDELFKVCMSLTGEAVRNAHGRQTVRFELAGNRYYAKIHRGVGWGEIIKNATRLCKPVLGAGDEWRAIQRVTQLGIATTPVVAYGCRGRNPATMQSFLVTQDIGPSVSLETLSEQAEHEGFDADLKWRLINAVAKIVRTLHTNGINHRDLYLCHFELRHQHRTGDGPLSGKLVLMDLHRAQIRRRVPHRWMVKDLAALLFSALDAPITKRDVIRFAKMYRPGSLTSTLKHDQRLWSRVWRKALRLHASHFNHTPRSAAAALAEVKR